MQKWASCFIANSRNWIEFIFANKCTCNNTGCLWCTRTISIIWYVAKLERREKGSIEWIMSAYQKYACTTVTSFCEQGEKKHVTTFSNASFCIICVFFFFFTWNWAGNFSWNLARWLMILLLWVHLVYQTQLNKEILKPAQNGMLDCVLNDYMVLILNSLIKIHTVKAYGTSPVW